MAMISVSKRKLEDYMVPKNSSNPSPTSYSPKQFDKSSVYKNLRAPPFNLQEQKWSPEKVAIKNNIPGPGAYNANNEFIEPNPGHFTMKPRTAFNSSKLCN